MAVQLHFLQEMEFEQLSGFQQSIASFIILKLHKNKLQLSSYLLSIE